MPDLIGDRVDRGNQGGFRVLPGNRATAVRGDRRSGLSLPLKALALGLLLAGGALLLLVIPTPDMAALEDTLRSWGIWGMAASVTLMVVHSFVPFPAEILACANGMVYGPVWGTAVTWVGAMLGALVAYGLARRLGRPCVQRFVAARDWTRIDEWTATGGWRAALLARFVPIIAFNLINYAAGLSRLSLWDFVWTTAVGILPVTVLMVVACDGMATADGWLWAMVLVGLGAAAVLLWRGHRRG